MAVVKKLKPQGIKKKGNRRIADLLKYTPESWRKDLKKRRKI